MPVTVAEVTSKRPERVATAAAFAAAWRAARTRHAFPRWLMTEEVVEEAIELARRGGLALFPDGARLVLDEVGNVVPLPRR